MARVDLPKSGIKRRRKKRRILLAAAGAGGVAAIVALGALLAHASFLRIERVVIAGAESVASSTVEHSVRQRLAGNYLFLFPKNNIFLYPQHGIEAALRGEYPLIKDARVRARDFHTIEVSLIEREPAALWCPFAGAPEEGACMLMDEEGVVYADAPRYSAPIYASYSGAAGGDPKQYLTPEQFRSLFALVDALNKKVASSTIVEVAVDGQNDVRAKFENGFELLFALGDDGGDIFERFTLALQAEPFVSHALADVAYLDLRFGEKLYYKLK